MGFRRTYWRAILALVVGLTLAVGWWAYRGIAGTDVSGVAQSAETLPLGGEVADLLLTGGAHGPLGFWRHSGDRGSITVVSGLMERDGLDRIARGYGLAVWDTYSNPHLTRRLVEVYRVNPAHIKTVFSPTDALVTGEATAGRVQLYYGYDDHRFTLVLEQGAQ